MKKTILPSSGREIPVHCVPPFALDAIESQFQDPSPPAETDSESVEWKLWASELAQIGEQREQAVTEGALLIALRDVEIPTDWQLSEVFRLAGVEARDGERGRHLDYAQYELLATAKDLTAVQNVMYGGLTAEEVKAAEATFRPPGQR